MTRSYLPVLFLLLAWGPVQGQWIGGRSIPELRGDSLLPLSARRALPSFSAPLVLKRQVAVRDYPTRLSVEPGPVVPKRHYYETLGFFCKMEIDMARRTRLPIKMRLGEVHYVERMEGKKGYAPQ